MRSTVPPRSSELVKVVDYLFNPSTGKYYEHYVDTEVKTLGKYDAKTD